MSRFSFFCPLVIVGLVGCELERGGSSASDRRIELEFCGNGVLDPGEACDEGPIGGPACSSRCDPLGRAGDGGDLPSSDDVTGDAGNAVGGDDCGADCTSNRCGDGELSQIEGCDDGNTDSGDGCSAECVSEYCLDGVVQAGIGEQCEPALADVACDDECRLMVCGDERLSINEACDDGNTDPGDGCDAECLPEFCGDGRVQAGIGEECDDQNAEDDDGCSRACRLEVCGDSRTQAGLGEDCDDGGTVAGDGCSETCRLEFCGDGHVQRGLGEECDDGPGNGTDAPCGETCQLAFCGDGRLQPSLGERCDDGWILPFDGCDGHCQPETLGAPGFADVGAFPAATWVALGADATGHRAALVTIDRPNDAARIVLRRFDGAGWSDPTIVHLDQPGPGGAFGAPVVAVAEDGRVAVAWQHQGWVDEPPFSLRIAVSDAEGVFAPAVDLGPTSERGLPDFVRLDVANGRFIATWLAPARDPRGALQAPESAHLLQVAVLEADGAGPVALVAVEPADDQGIATKQLSVPFILPPSAGESDALLVYADPETLYAARVTPPAADGAPEVGLEAVVSARAPATLAIAHAGRDASGRPRVAYAVSADVGDAPRLRVTTRADDGWSPPADLGGLPWPVSRAPTAVLPGADDRLVICQKSRPAIRPVACTRLPGDGEPEGFELASLWETTAKLSLHPAEDTAPLMLVQLLRGEGDVLVGTRASPEATAHRLVELAISGFVSRSLRDGRTLVAISTIGEGLRVLLFDPQGDDDG